MSQFCDLELQTSPYYLVSKMASLAAYAAHAPCLHLANIVPILQKCDAVCRCCAMALV